MTNPYRLPNRPRVTLQDIVVWAAGQTAPITIYSLRAAFGLERSDAGVRLMKLHRWGYLRRYKPEDPPIVWHYTLTRFGKKRSRAWK